MTKSWILKNAVDFYKYKDNWQHLSNEILGCDHPLMHADYVEPIIKYFAPNDLKLALKGSSGEEGMVLLKKKQWGVWESFFPKTGPFSFSLIKNSKDGFATDLISTLVSSLPGFACLFAFYKLDSDFLTVRTNNNKKNIGKLKFIDTIRIPIDRSFDEYWNARSKNLKRNIIKKKNRIEKNGIDLDFRELREPDQMYEGVEAYGNLESSGWKGDIGTAVNIDNHRGSFYVEMLKRFASRGKACIYQLLLDNKVVASALTIQGGGMIVILKIAYDEDMKEYSPGMIMYYELHKKLFITKEVKTIEYYGKATQRMQQWAVDIREIYHLNYYRSPLIKNIIYLLRKLRILKKLGKF